MDDRAARIAEVLQTAAETHHLVYRITDGEDEDWASWYADWLLALSELPNLLGGRPVRSELVWLLVTLDKKHTSEQSGGRWEQYYARGLIEHFVGNAPSA